MPMVWYLFHLPCLIFGKSIRVNIYIYQLLCIINLYERRHAGITLNSSAALLLMSAWLHGVGKMMSELCSHFHHFLDGFIDVLCWSGACSEFRLTQSAE